MTACGSEMTGHRLARALRRLRGRGTPPPDVPHEQLAHLDAADRAIVERALPYTMTGVPRLAALVDGVRHVVRRGIPGALAECGVWRGGSVLAMALTLLELDETDRELHLYDTFAGMTRPTEHDVSALDGAALATWEAARAQDRRAWAELFDPRDFNEDAVRATLLASGYPAQRIHLHRGPVEDTLPAAAPGPLALLRLDTDWYESTRHELEQLYPLLTPGGVLIVDDYGHWEGARRAVDEYFEAHPPAPLLARIDYTGRIAVKP